MNVLVYDNEEQIGIAAGNYMCGQVLAKPNSVLGLATGSTPLKPYGHMIKLYEAGAVDFSKVTTFNLDEYCDLPKAHKNSYYTFMLENLFSKVDVNLDNVGFLDGNAADPEFGGRYGFNVSCLSAPGKIAELTGVEEVKAFPEVIDAVIAHYPGETITEDMKGLLAQITVRVLGTVDSEEQLYDIMRRIEKTIHIISDDGRELMLAGIEPEDIEGYILR